MQVNTSEVFMKVVDHPYLEGIKCREDGAVFVPWGGRRKGSRWTFGCRRYDGYLQVSVAGKLYLVHRLVCEAFHGEYPEGKSEVDHINRNRADNSTENLRWSTPSENSRNTSVHEVSVAKYGVAAADNAAAYQLSRYRNDPDFRERKLAQQRARYTNDPEYRRRHKESGRHRRKCA